MIETSIHQEDIAILNVHVLNNSSSKNMKQKWTELKGDIDKVTIMLRTLMSHF